MLWTQGRCQQNPAEPSRVQHSPAGAQEPVSHLRRQEKLLGWTTGGSTRLLAANEGFGPGDLAWADGDVAANAAPELFL